MIELSAALINGTVLFLMRFSYATKCCLRRLCNRPRYYTELIYGFVENGLQGNKMRSYSTLKVLGDTACLDEGSDGLP
jgi:hypothetical protein